MKTFLKLTFTLFLLQSCSDETEKLHSKGFQVSEISTDEEGNKVVGLPIDSLSFATQPTEVLATHYQKYRLTPVFKVNYDRKGNPFVGELESHFSFEDEDALYETVYDNHGNHKRIRRKNVKNDWNSHLMAGFSAVYGYNLVNFSLYDSEKRVQKEFFQKPVLIKTLYYPSFGVDTLNYKPVIRDFYMISVYDEDTNKDGYININDLRRFYHFDLELTRPTALLPKEYSVVGSSYGSENDHMYVFARYDKNKNGQIDKDEPTHIYWIDLKNPSNRDIHYKN